MFEVRPLAWDSPEANRFDALLLASANTLRHGGAALESYRDLPVYAVGETTAQAARKAGFTLAQTGRGGLQSLLATLAPDHRRLLRLGGRERIDLRLPEGVRLAERAVYASEALPMPAELARMLDRPALVLLHSGRAAAHFASECDRLGKPRDAISIAALAPRIAEAAGHGWRELDLAETTEEAALLALARQICKEAR